MFLCLNFCLAAASPKQDYYSPNMCAFALAGKDVLVSQGGGAHVFVLSLLSEYAQQFQKYSLLL
jgi:hypothetical protein